jgi:ASPIC/UnbV protein
VHFGLGSMAAMNGVIVQWPDGPRERWTSIAGDRLVTLARGTGKSF